jgi:transposase-like protein
MVAVSEGSQREVTEYVQVVRTIPVCPVHRTPMRRHGSGKGSTTRYKCPLCDCGGKGTKQVSKFSA